MNFPGSPWYSGGVTVNYPIWAAYHLQSKREGIASGDFKRFTLSRNTLDVDIPDGWPTEQNEVLVEVIARAGKIPDVIEALWYPGCGYNVHETALVIDEPRRLTEETKQRMRRNALRKRITAKNPMFAEDEITAIFEKQPEYYGNIRP